MSQSTNIFYKENAFGNHRWESSMGPFCEKFGENRLVYHKMYFNQFKKMIYTYKHQNDPFSRMKSISHKKIKTVLLYSVRFGLFTQGSTYRKIFIYQTSKILHFSIQIMYHLRANWAKIHSPNRQLYLPSVTREWDKSSPVYLYFGVITSLHQPKGCTMKEMGEIDHYIIRTNFNELQTLCIIPEQRCS